MNNADQPSMPTKHNSEHFQSSHTYTAGLTKREHFSAMAMCSILNARLTNKSMLITVNNSHSVAADAVLMADALLEELEK